MVIPGSETSEEVAAPPPKKTQKSHSNRLLVGQSR